jgi:ribosomal protein S18 acetylase RimI-like enzyme
MSIDVRRATDDDLPALSAVLGRAFSNDPTMVWVFRDEATRLDRLTALFTLALLGVFLPAGAIDVTTDVAGAALWEHRDPASPAAPEGEDDDFPAAMTAAGFLPDEVDRMQTFLGMMADAHPAEPAHWYLGILGVDLDRQGQGIGSACMAPRLATCDAEGVPAYLESSNERNVPLYERHGFRTVGIIDLPDGPPLWRMWREPQPVR